MGMYIGCWAVNLCRKLCLGLQCLLRIAQHGYFEVKFFRTPSN